MGRRVRWRYFDAAYLVLGFVAVYGLCLADQASQNIEIFGGAQDLVFFVLVFLSKCGESIGNVVVVNTILLLFPPIFLNVW